MIPWQDTMIAGSDLSARARNALTKEGVLTAGDLAALPFNAVARLAEVGVQTRREIRGWLVEVQHEGLKLL